MTALPSVRYLSWAGDTGYGTASKALLRTAKAAGLPLRWDALMPRGRLQIGPPAYYRRLSAREVADTDLAPLTVCEGKCSRAIIHTPADYFPHWRRQLGAIPTLGYTAWETDRLPAHWPACLREVEGVLVPSKWCMQRFRDSGVSGPVSVVPHISQLRDVPLCARRLGATIWPRGSRSRREPSSSWRSASGPDARGWICSWRPGRVRSAGRTP